ncbi:hypothetical protein [Kocuria sp.]|uniref:hypothetical protein n=1 Tax=Kocuria sp. TaxID=1871328 RepID=UPI002810DCD7|nr:hypothetical protein [Kocuria sp.]
MSAVKLVDPDFYVRRTGADPELRECFVDSTHVFEDERTARIHQEVLAAEMDPAEVVAELRIQRVPGGEHLGAVGWKLSGWELLPAAELRRQVAALHRVVERLGMAPAAASVPHYDAVE